MAELIYTSEENFKDTIVQVEDELLFCAEEIHDITEKEYPILTNNDGSKLFVMIPYTREEGEADTHKYKITIEKIPYE